MASSSSSSSFPYLVLACLNFTLFILSAASLAPTFILKSSPTSMGWALIMPFDAEITTRPERSNGVGEGGVWGVGGDVCVAGGCFLFELWCALVLGEKV
ncbi:unnamed protein product [Lactuca saligna]|uniref:Uncharacterized protein n=1 Tax=Lactuca saligna TaxID=75948 RepID=A0AA35ZIB0_LACSI|nr:unnamed protein product [Lactuca saligna]